jgi:PAS domain S-box-containing protein
MDTSRVGLAAFIKDQSELILRIWDLAVERVSSLRDVPEIRREVLVHVLDRVAVELAPGAGTDPDELERAISEHVFQCSEAGISHVQLAAEVMALRDAIQVAWPGSDEPGARETIDTLGAVFDRILLAALDRFRVVRIRLLEIIEVIVRGFPGATLDQTLQRVLNALVQTVDEIDAAFLLLRENDHLRVRAAVGLDASLDSGVWMWIGEGFAGLIAAERKPRLSRRAKVDPLVQSPMVAASELRGLYGIPMIHEDEVVGVACVGSLGAEDFGDETKAVLRAIMNRVVGLLYHEILRERLELEQVRYRTVLDAAPTMIVSTDLEGRYIVVNRRALAESGLTRDQAIGKTTHDVFPRELADSMRAHEQRVIETGAVVEEIETIRRGAAVRTYLGVRFPIFDAQGTLVAIGGVATDITERRRAEVGQQLMAEIGGLLATSVDVEDTLVLIARSVVPALADSCIIELIEDDGAIHRALVHHGDPARAGLARAFENMAIDPARPHLTQSVLARREPILMSSVHDHYLDTIAQNDAQRELLRELAPSSMIHIPLAVRGRLFGAWVFVRCGDRPVFDRADLKTASQLGWLTSLGLDRARLHRIARSASEARDEMLGTVAHDLRNPISAILVAIDALIEAAPSAAASQAVDAIARAAHRMDKLVGDLLDQHAIESGQLALDVAQRDAEDLVEDVLAAQRGRVEAAGLTCDSWIAGRLPEVRVDADRVQQVFENLIGNAIRFTPRGGRITIGAESEPGFVRFSVADSGPGFSPADLPHVFDRFWRARRADRGGTGLGLAICKGIVEAHGGRIWAANDHGAVVSFTLPRASEAQSLVHDQMSSTER